MQKVLIADISYLLANTLAAELDGDFEVRICSNGRDASELLVSFKPDIVILDATLTDDNGITILDTLRFSSLKPHLIALSFLVNERVLKYLSKYEITCVIPKPLSTGYVVNTVKEIAFEIENPLATERPLEYDINILLLSLSFTVGTRRYRCVSTAIAERFNNPHCAMKELYIDVAKKCGGTPQSVEKAIRDAIASAAKVGNPNIWSSYFPAFKTNSSPCKGNEAFIDRMVYCIKQQIQNCKRSKTAANVPSSES